MFSPALQQGKTTPYIPTPKAGGFTAIFGKPISGLFDDYGNPKPSGNAQRSDPADVGTD